MNLPNVVIGDIVVCYDDGDTRKVARLWPGEGRRRPQWHGFGGDVVDGLSQWGAVAEPGASVIVVSTRDRTGWGRRIPIVGHCPADLFDSPTLVKSMASAWRVPESVITEALQCD